MVGMFVRHDDACQIAGREVQTPERSRDAPERYARVNKDVGGPFGYKRTVAGRRAGQRTYSDKNTPLRPVFASDGVF
jgi:hypothetical protein